MFAKQLFVMSGFHRRIFHILKSLTIVVVVVVPCFSFFCETVERADRLPATQPEYPDNSVPELGGLGEEQTEQEDGNNNH